MRRLCLFFFVIFLLFGLAPITSVALMAQAAAAEVRIKDIVDIEGVRENDLIGYGIVVGLNGTGDSVKNSPYTEDALSNLLERLGVNVLGDDIKPNNVAAVLVTAKLPAFARAGSTIDVTVSSIGDAKSLAGGVLILTPLNGADNEIYAVAQGSVLVSGLDARADGARQTQGTPTGGLIPNGARIERELAFDFSAQTHINLALRNPDFTTAARIEAAINKQLNAPLAMMRDPGTISLDLSQGTGSAAAIIAQIENLTVSPVQTARIVIDEKSGTIVLGQDVKISTVAIAQGNISIKITETPYVSQPNPFSKTGETIVVPRSTITVTETGNGSLAALEENVTLTDLIAGLNALGVSPREMADIIRTMKSAGAIHADLIIQ